MSVRSNSIVRDRALVALPSFATGFNFKRTNARYDKFSINFDIAISDVSRISAIKDSFVQIAENSDFLRFEGSDSYPELHIRKRNNDLLFGGKINTQQNRNGHGYKIRAYINLNPTRFFSQNPINRRVSGENGKLECNERERVNCSIYAVDGQDNVVLNERLREARNTSWNALLGEYIHLIQNKIIDQFERYGSVDYMSGHDNTFYQTLEYEYPDSISGWTIGYAEIFWEFGIPEENAEIIVKDFCSYLKGSLPETRESFHLNAIDQKDYTTSYIFGTGKKNEKIAVYAKACDRIRVEYRFLKNPKEDRSNLNNQEFPNTSEEALFEIIDELTRISSRAMRNLQAHKREYDSSDVLNPAMLADELRAISYYAENKATYYKRMVNSLIACGKVREEDSKDYNDFLSKLEQRGILKKCRKKPNQKRVYSVEGMLRKLLKN